METCFRYRVVVKRIADAHGAEVDDERRGGERGDKRTEIDRWTEETWNIIKTG